MLCGWSDNELRPLLRCVGCCRHRAFGSREIARVAAGFRPIVTCPVECLSYGTLRYSIGAKFTTPAL